MHDFFFRYLLKLLPAEFRGDYGREMETAFRDERRDANRRGAMFGLWMSTIADILKTAPTEHWDIFKRDTRFAFRTAVARPAHTLTSIFTLALGLGASVVMFAVVDAVLLSPMPYRNPEQLVQIQETSKGGDGSNLGYLTFVDLRDRTRSVQSMAAISQTYATLTGKEGDAERVSAMRASSSYFDVVGVKPSLGRAFTDAEDKPGVARRVTILTDGLWRRRFRADPSILGKPIDIGGNPFVVVGVMPRDFKDIIGERLYEGAELWTPLGYNPAASFACRTCRHLGVIARLAPPSTTLSAGKEMTGLLTELAAQHPKEYNEPAIRATRLDDVFLGPVRTVLSVLSVGVFALLLVACFTVANLLLLRANERTREIAVRVALGVSSARMARQLITESLLLAFAGGLVGLGPAWAMVRVLATHGPSQLPRLQDVALDARSIAVAFGLIVVSGVLFGLAPMRQLIARDLASDIHGGNRTTGTSWGFRAALVGVNVALAAVLLVGSGLLVRSLVGLLAVNPGFDPSGVSTMRLSLSGAEYQDADSAKAIAKTVAFYDSALSRIRALPGVIAAAGVTTLPLGGNVDGFGLHVASKPLDNPESAPYADRFVVTPDFFKALAVPLRSGRLLADTDVQTAPRVAVINETLAREIFPNGDALGQELMLGPIDAAHRTIVGIVGNVAHQGLDKTPQYQVYVPQSQWAWAEGTLTLIVRTSGDPNAIAMPVRRVLREIDERQPITNVQSYPDIVAASMGARRLAAWLLSAFAVSAFILAIVGLYGAVSVLVGQKQREIGVRLALGARVEEIRRMVLTKGMVPVFLGLVGGFVTAGLAVATLESMLYRVKSLDPATFIAAFIALTTAAMAACAIPAWRASRTDPAVTLRVD